MEQHFEERKKIHLTHPLPSDIFYTFHNDNTIDQQIESAIDKMKMMFNGLKNE